MQLRCHNVSPMKVSHVLCGVCESVPALISLDLAPVFLYSMPCPSSPTPSLIPLFPYSALPSLPPVALGPSPASPLSPRSSATPQLSPLLWCPTILRPFRPL